MHLTSKRHEQITIIRLSGRIDALSAEELLASLMTLLKSNPPLLLIDMHEVSYLSSAGMRTFLMTVREAEAMQGRVLFAGFGTMVAEVLDLAGLTKYFPSVGSVEEGLRFFS